MSHFPLENIIPIEMNKQKMREKNTPFLLWNIEAEKQKTLWIT